jgi:glycosyltransferase involved in cell wall biosynthesis/SAM-dependent methyltransferase
MIYLTPVPDWESFHGYYDWLFQQDHPEDAAPPKLPGDRRGLLGGFFRQLRRCRFRPHSWPLEAGEGRRLLDVGCGDGFKLAEFSARGWQVYGVDVSAPALEMARRAVPEGTFLLGELDEVQLPPASFDFIRVDNVLEHVFRPKALLASCRRLLKADGQLLVFVPRGDSLSMRLLGRYSNNAWIPFHLSLFTLAALRRVLVEAGFGTLQIRQTSPLNWLPSGIKQLVGRAGRPLPAVLEWALIGAMYPIGALAASIGWGEELVAIARRSGEQVIATGAGRSAVAAGEATRMSPVSPPARQTNGRRADFSVIIPVFNGESTLARAIDSAVNQTQPPAEVFVIDDGSTDNTRQVASSYGDKIHYVPRRHSGKAAVARNVGIRESHADYLAFLDADDAWHPQKLERVAATISGHPGVGLFYSDFEVVDEEYRLLYLARVKDISPNAYKLLLRFTPIATVTTVVRRDCFERCGLFWEGLPPGCEDWDMWIRIARLFPVLHIPEVLARYTLHSRSASLMNCEDWFISQEMVVARVLSVDEGLSESERRAIRAAQRYNAGRARLQRRQFERAARNMKESIRLNPLAWRSWFFFALLRGRLLRAVPQRWRRRLAPE